MINKEYIHLLQQNILSSWIISYLFSFIIFTTWFFLILMKPYFANFKIRYILPVYFSFSAISFSLIMDGLSRDKLGAYCYLGAIAFYLIYAFYLAFEGEQISILIKKIKNNELHNDEDFIRLSKLKKFLLYFRVSLYNVLYLFILIFGFMIVLKILISISSLNLYTRIALALIIFYLGIHNIYKRNYIFKNTPIEILEDTF